MAGEGEEVVGVADVTEVCCLGAGQARLGGGQGGARIGKRGIGDRGGGDVGGARVHGRCAGVW